jgi:hypothetical protein
MTKCKQCDEPLEEWESTLCEGCGTVNENYNEFGGMDAANCEHETVKQDAG